MIYVPGSIYNWEFVEYLPDMCDACIKANGVNTGILAVSVL